MLRLAMLAILTLPLAGLKAQSAGAAALSRADSLAMLRAISDSLMQLAHSQRRTGDARLLVSDTLLSDALRAERKRVELVPPRPVITCPFRDEQAGSGFIISASISVEAGKPPQVSYGISCKHSYDKYWFYEEVLLEMERDGNRWKVARVLEYSIT